MQDWTVELMQGIQVFLICLLIACVGMLIYDVVQLIALQKRSRKRKAEYDRTQAENGWVLLAKLIEVEEIYLKAGSHYEHGREITKSFNNIRTVVRGLLPLLWSAGPLSEEVAQAITEEIERMDRTYGYPN